ncbi:MAG: DNA polymerase III subunit beta [Burkholderiaceae bacterium]|jgi:DNA polymerase-3 subunit beta|nr:DNA polymerase III subunit beta [Gemmatimonadales bacterium]MCO5118221.1 DNA polymerase III subunit beta [Burkholderiaceae bacterium]MEB2319479.1 DNA polymerase III subunit beta [Pseudomonadota bacterium]
MLLMKANRDAILKPLQTVAGIVERRHTLPILANVLIRKNADVVSLLATDVEIQISTEAELGGDPGPAATTVAARKLIDILRSLPESAEVSISLDNRKASVRAGKSRFALQTLGADDYPTVTVSEDTTTRFTLPQDRLKHLFHMVHFAMAQQDIRYYLNGLLLVTDGDLIRVVATDGHRLAYCQAEVEGAGLARQEVIIPRKTVLELQRLLADSEDPVDITVAPNQVRFAFGGVEMISKLVEGKFPDYQRVIPQGYGKRLVIRRDDLAASLGRASILTTEKFKGVRLAASDQGLKVQITNAEQEEAVDEIEGEYNGDPIEVGFNVSYLQDVLGNLKVENVSIEFGDSNTSALLTVPDDESFKYVVMPMRI